MRYGRRPSEENLQCSLDSLLSVSPLFHPSPLLSLWMNCPSSTLAMPPRRCEILFPHLLGDITPEVIPCPAKTINTSLSVGSFPEAFRIAVIALTLKAKIKTLPLIALPQLPQLPPSSHPHCSGRVGAKPPGKNHLKLLSLVPRLH